MSKLQKKLGLKTTTLLVVANIIGAGIFGTMGDIALVLGSDFTTLLCWFSIGVMAISGALCYSEVAVNIPRSGGEYNFLTVLYHPALGFLSGFVSLIVGFSASIAFTSEMFSINVLELIGHKSNDPELMLYKKAISVLFVLALTLMHSFKVTFGTNLQNIFTLIKIIIIILLIITGLFLPTSNPEFSLIPDQADINVLLSDKFGIGLTFVFYSYLGYNAAIYIINEIDNPSYVVPRALIFGTSLVILLYLGLNYVFLSNFTFAEIAGNKQGGIMLGNHFFGAIGGRIIVLFIIIAFFSSASSMVFAGPRITQTMGEDFSIFKLLSKTNQHGVPVYTMWLQFGIVVLIILTSKALDLLKYIGFTLSIFSLLTVAGVFIIRYKKLKFKPQQPNSGEKILYKTPFFPLTPLVFIGIVGWMVFMMLVNAFTPNPNSSDDPMNVIYYSVGTILLGVVIYYLSQSFSKKNN